jgi:mRNA interferase MazF
MVSKWDIYFCNLDPTQGSEQRGLRPVLVVSNNAVNHNLSVSTVLPLSSIKDGGKIYPTEILLETDITGLPKNSVAMVQQIRTVAHSRLNNLAGQLECAVAREKILEAIRLYFEVYSLPLQ